LKINIPIFMTDNFSVALHNFIETVKCGIPAFTAFPLAVIFFGVAVTSEKRPARREAGFFGLAAAPATVLYSQDFITKAMQTAIKEFWNQK